MPNVTITINAPQGGWPKESGQVGSFLGLAIRDLLDQQGIAYQTAAPFGPQPDWRAIWKGVVSEAPATLAVTGLSDADKTTVEAGATPAVIWNLADQFRQARDVQLTVNDLLNEGQVTQAQTAYTDALATVPARLLVNVRESIEDSKEAGDAMPSMDDVRTFIAANVSDAGTRKVLLRLFGLIRRGRAI